VRKAAEHKTLPRSNETGRSESLNGGKRPGFRTS
jgi:hypothetical protein